MNLKQLITSDLQSSLNKCGINAEASVSQSGKPDIADYQTNMAFSLAKQMQVAPMVAAQKIVDNLPKSDAYEASITPPAFINFKFTSVGLNKFANYCLADAMVGVQKVENPRKIFMDYGGANVAKELHIGHLRSPIIGESLARLHKLLGDNVISDVYLGDWGTQMGLTIAQMEDEGWLEFEFGRAEKPQKITLEMLNIAYPKASKRKSSDTQFKKRADDYTLKVQNKQQPYYGIYQTIWKLSVDRIKQNYTTLGCNFDLYNGESTAQPWVEPTIEIFKQKGLAKRSNGALIVDVSLPGENEPSGKFDQNGKELLKNPMPPVMLQKTNGGDIYDSTELATINMRYTKYKPDEFIYVVDNRQSQHFVIAFRAAKMAGLVAQDTVLKHVAYGTINGADGKPFKTRSGDVVKLEDIIELIKQSAVKKLAENGIEGSDDLALEIGLAAIKFADLSCLCSRDYVFDIDKFSSFEGKTGPYIQYTGTRIKSLLSKASGKPTKIDIFDADQREIVLALDKLCAAYASSYADYSLNSLCLALYNLCAAFSRFYNNTRILTEPDDNKRGSYLALCRLVLRAIEQASDVIGFVIPNRM